MAPARDVLEARNGSARIGQHRDGRRRLQRPSQAVRVGCYLTCLSSILPGPARLWKGRILWNWTSDSRELASRFLQTPASHEHISATCGCGAKLFMAASKAGRIAALSNLAWPSFSVPVWREVDVWNGVWHAIVGILTVCHPDEMPPNTQCFPHSYLSETNTYQQTSAVVHTFLHFLAYTLFSLLAKTKKRTRSSCHGSVSTQAKVTRRLVLHFGRLADHCPELCRTKQVGRKSVCCIGAFCTEAAIHNEILV